MKLKRTTPLLALAAAAALAGLSAAAALLAQRPATAVEPTASPSRADGRVATVESREVADVYVADAVIEAVRQATVSAQIAGQITRLYADAGDRVRRGQLLATIDTRETDAQVAASRAGLAQAEAQLEQARLHFERTASLVKSGFVSQAALDQAQADYRAAQARVEVARAGASTASTARSFAEVRAPFDGVVGRRLADVGDLAVAGRPIFDVHAPGALRAVGSVPQFVLPQVAGVRQASVKVPTQTEAIAATQVTVLPAADARLLSTQVRAELPANLPPGVVPGTAAKILLPVGTTRRLAVPAAAVVRRGELTLATVVAADGRTSLRQIRVGDAVDDGWIEVLAGLDAGERVALDPLAAR